MADEVIRNIAGTILLAAFLVSGIVGSEMGCRQKTHKESPQGQSASPVALAEEAAKDKGPGKSPGDVPRVKEAPAEEGGLMDPQASAAYSSARLLLEILGSDEKETRKKKGDGK